MSSGDKVIEVKGLRKYFGETKALEDVSFDVFRGDVFGFLGPNGAGKSTTIRSILSLVKPDGGEIKIFGKDPARHRREVFSDIGCIVEKPDFYRYLSARKNLEILARVSGKEIKKNRIEEILEFVGLKGRGHDKVKGFSHGMKQRLGLAQSLIHDPSLIILDEPTTGLDPQGIIDIRNLILKLSAEHKKTILLSSHLLSEIELIANRMVIIHKGKTLVAGDVKELLHEQELLVCFTVDDLAKARETAIAFRGAGQIKSAENGKLLMHISEEDTALLNNLFCGKGLKVYSIESKRKLEDYFLKLVSH
jgi:ABC-type multidrug transport system ATPase subunit